MMQRSFFIVLLCGIASTASVSRDIPSNWVPECVGRTQLSLPGTADVAANSYKAFTEAYKGGSYHREFVFPDGQEAGWSAIFYFGGFMVSHPLDKKQREDLLLAAGVHANETRARAKANGWVYEDLKSPGFPGEAYRIDSQLVLSLYVAPVFVRLSSITDQKWEERKGDYSLLTANLSYRPFGEVPAKSGVCLPHLFVSENSGTNFSIATTYRLNNQPDITIRLEETSAPRVMPGQNPDKFTAESMSNFFWTQNYGWSVRKSVESYWSDSYRPIKFAGRPGVESFVKIVRKDDSEDFGYLAVSRGDPNKKDVPDPTLYVIRDGKNARAKGVEPLDKGRFLEMAQTIVESVKRRDFQ